MALLASIVVGSLLLGAPGSNAGTAASASNLTGAAVRAATLPEAAAGMAAEYDAAAGAVFLLGGYGATCGTTCASKTLTDQALRYDPSVDRFDPAPPLTDANGDPLHLALAAHVDVPGRGIYLFGGIEHGGPDAEASCAGACTVTNAIRRYDPETGETVTLGATLPSARDRAAAAFDPDTGLVYVVGGVGTDGALGSPLHELVAFDPQTETIVGSTVDLPTHGYYVAAGYIPYTRPQGDPGVDPQFVQPGPQDHGFLELVATGGVVEYYPTSTDVPNFYDFDITGQASVGSAWAYEAGRKAVLAAGGFCGPAFSSGCPQNALRDYALDRGPLAAGTVANPLPAGVAGATSLDANSQLDGAAVYVSPLDRVISFGGFMAPKSPVVWDDSPDGPQFRDLVYSLSPPPYAAGGVLGPVPIDSPSLVVGAQRTVSVQLGAPGQRFAIGLQTSYRPPGQDDEVMTRALAFTTQATADPTVVDATFTVPSDITPGSDERAAGLCAIPLDAVAPQNCREVILTTRPGRLHIAISGVAPGGSAQPLTRATVRLLDRDGHVVDEQPNLPTATYANDGLASGTYTVQVWREFVHGDTVLYLPHIGQAAVRVGQELDTSVTLQGTDQLGPVAQAVTASHDAEPGPAVGTFVAFPSGAGYAPQVPVTFTVDGLVEPFADPLDGGSHTNRVDFTLNGHTSSDTSGADGWTATFDMSTVLLPGPNVLHVTAQDSGQHTGPSFEVPIDAIAAKPFENTFNPAVTWDPDSETYTAQFIVPAQPRLRYPDDPPAVTDLVLFKLYSQARADMQFTERYSLDGKWEASGDGAVLAQFLSTSPNRFNLAYPFTVTPSYAPDGTVDSYTVTVDVDVCHALQSAESDVTRTVGYMRRLTDPGPYLIGQQSILPCNQWMPVFGGTIFDWPGVATLRVSVDMRFGAHFILQGTLDGSSFDAREIRAIPSPDVAVRLAADLDVLSGTVSGGAWAVSDLFAQEPIVYASTHSPPVYLDNPCFRLLVTGGAWIESPFGKSTYGPQTFLDEQRPTGCFTSAAATAAAERAAAVAFATPRVMPQPATATDPAPGGGTMRLWIGDADPSGVPVPRLHFESGGTQGPVHAVGVQEDPSVAFLGDHRAVAAWTQIDLTRAQASTLSPTAIARHQEIDVAFWDGTSWDEPTPLTSNRVGDGRAVVTETGSGGAVVAWVHDTDGNPATKGDWQVVARTWDGAAWSAPHVFGHADGAADLEPALAQAPDGDAWLVWTHDADGDFTTNDDRRLRYAVWNATGGEWGAVRQPPSWPSGAMTPSLAFSPMSGRPLVAMSVVSTMQKAPGATNAKPAGLGTEGLLYAAWGAPGLAAGAWDVQQIGNTAPGRADDPRVEWPQALLLPGSNDVAVVVSREFGGDGLRPNAGQAAAVEANLGATSARWATPGSLTTGSTMAWQIDASGGDPGQQTPLDLVGVTSAAPGSSAAIRTAAAEGPRSAVPRSAAHVVTTSDGSSIFSIQENTTGTDLGIAGVALSDPTPAPGENVTATVDVTNPDLQPVSTAMGGSPTFDVDLYRVQDTCPSPAERTDFGRVGTATVTQDVLFDERVPVTFQFTATGAPEHLLACLYFQDDLGGANNQATASLGSLPAVLGVKAAHRAEGSIAVQWLDENQPVDDPVGYRVFRADTRSGPWTLAGTTTGTAITDVGANATSRFYRVRAFDARGLVSPPGTPVAASAVATDLTVAGAGSAGNDRAEGKLSPADPGATVRVTLFVKSNGTFVEVAVKNATLGAAADPDGDGVATSAYVASFTRPAGTTCRVTASYAGDATHLASSATDTFAC